MKGKGIYMLTEAYSNIERLRTNISTTVDDAFIEEKERELGIDFPEMFKIFMRTFGNDDIIMNGDYTIYPLEDIYISGDKVCIGMLKQKGSRLAYDISKLQYPHPAVEFESNPNEWFIHRGNDVIFFLEVVGWNLMKSMEKTCKITIRENKFKTLIGKAFNYIGEHKVFASGAVVIVHSDDILGCYFPLSSKLFLGTNSENVLEKFAETYNLKINEI